MAHVFLGLGSNLGDRKANLRLAVRRLRELMQITRVSSLYETGPVGFPDQPDFLNAVAEAETILSPSGLLTVIKEVEESLGREPTFRYGPRAIDVDVLLYDDIVFHGLELEVPHPRLHERRFVLEPLVELAPDVVHPVLLRPVSAILADLPEGERVTVVEADWLTSGEAP
ncbi:MAG: 2-amino-4-hydroxy-6-hydroxymethyldihydropteridine diphosphokinase [Chloroflexi bacterium]|nr:2-amino-4-hydroxy-6-hydroxymethyldihydropteridine diphosphokinase [Chloroflexota bacterium]